MKRRLSSSDAGHENKRARTASTRIQDLSDELQIHILQGVETAQDLASVSRVSTHFKRLAEDSLVWKSLFIRHFSQDFGRSDAALKKLASTHGGRWKQLYRLQTNWKDGSVSSSYILRHALLAQPPLDLQPELEIGNSTGSVPQQPAEAARDSKSIVQFIGQHVFIANKTAVHAVPTITLHRLAAGSEAASEMATFQPASLVAFYTERPHILNSRPLSITELRLDEGQQTDTNIFRLAVFYSSGQYVLLRVHLQDRSSIAVVEEHVSLDLSLTDRPDPVTTARYHLPLLVTITERFVLRVHHVVLNKETADFELLLNQASLQSHLCWRPLALSLRRRSKSQFRADLVYSSPWFPDSFTISVQEFRLTLPSSEDVSGQLEIQTSAATAVPLGESARPRPLVTGLDLHNDFVVASREDNTIDLLEIVRPKKTSTAPLRLEHRRRLFSHTCAVHSVSFDGSRCVSGARDGSVKVWHLSQQQRQARVAAAQSRRRKVTASSSSSSSSSWSGRPKYQEVVQVTEPPAEDEEQNELQWTEQWSTNAAAGAVEWVDFDTDKIVLSTPEKIKILSFV